jgi:RNA recognition motif-containing protein
MFDRKTNRSRGFGFITFATEESVRTVLSRDHEIMGKYVEIKRAEPRESSYR